MGALTWEHRSRRGSDRVGNHSPRVLCRSFPLLFHLRRQGGIVLRLTAPSFIEDSNKSEGGGFKDERRSQVTVLSGGSSGLLWVVGCGGADEDVWAAKQSIQMGR